MTDLWSGCWETSTHWRGAGCALQLQETTVGKQSSTLSFWSELHSTMAALWMQRLTKVWRFSPNMEVRGCKPRRFGDSMQDAHKGHQGRPSVFLCAQEKAQAVRELLELCESAQNHKCRVKTATCPPQGCRMHPRCHVFLPLGYSSWNPVLIRDYVIILLLLSFVAATGDLSQLLFSHGSVFEQNRHQY